jgi:hypothetical protein
MPMPMPTTQTTAAPEIERIVEAIRARRTFVLSSHARPDGDAIGSQFAMAYALRALGKHVRVVNRDPAPPFLMAFAGVPEIEVAPEVAGDFDAAIIMECGDLARTGVAGLDRGFVINIDHHPGNAGYGQINWFDASAAACGEMVFDVVRALGVPLTLEIATHIYVAILTDTGSFHFSSISPRTFDICRETLEAGVDPVESFLLGEHAGHCELFASSAVLLLRLRGVPARYVTGFRGGEWNGVTNAILGGWEVDLIEKITTGFPLFVVDSANGSGVGFSWNGNSLNRPDQISDPNKAGIVAANPDPGCQILKSVDPINGRAPDRVGTNSNWFNPCAFTHAQDGELGNANRAPLYGPRFVNTDLSFIKHFPLPYEGVRLDFRAEFFNAFNHAQFYLPGASSASALFQYTCCPT